MTSQTPRRGRRVHNGDNRGICPTERARRAARGGGGGGAPLMRSLPRAHASRRASLGCRYLASAHIVDEDGEATRALLGARAARASAMAAAGG